MADSKLSSAGVEPDKTYPLPIFQSLTGLGDGAMRTARRRGLRVQYTGNRGYVNGSDFIEYLDKRNGGTDSE